MLEVVGSEGAAELVCSILRDAGVPCLHRITNLGSGAMDGLTTGGPREVVVRRDDLGRARRLVAEHRDRPDPPGPSGGGREPEPEAEPASAVSAELEAERSLTRSRP